ncbi:glucose-1-phosphate thymidylyltransferase [bacterium]|nr:glucose-1-phosphate thymidylyltransferase [bacterium]
MKIVLFEDNQCRNLRPIGLFRPLFDLHAGSWTLFRLVRQLDCPVQAIIREHFLFEAEDLPVLESPLREPHLFLNASVEPDVRYLEKLRDIMKAKDPFITTSGNRVTAAVVPQGKKLEETVIPDNISALLLEMDLPLEGELFRTIDWPHEIVESHLRLYETNLEKVISSGNYRQDEAGVFLGEDVNLASSTEFDTANGPVVIDSGVRVRPFTCFEGPVHIGIDSVVTEHSSVKDMTSVGHGCKIGGEVEKSIIEPHSNKQHHGFLGHSWVGRWVNLGAGTTTSDLKNTYGAVRVQYGNQRIGTNMQFLGSVIGDFAKTAVNTTLFTGKIVGVCSMIYGMVTTNVPSFSNYARSFGQVTEINPEQVITTQKRMFARRDRKQSRRDVEMIKRVHKLTRDERAMSDEQITF